MKINMRQALELWREGYENGLGYVPYVDKPGPKTLESAIKNFQADGWSVAHAGGVNELTIMTYRNGGLIGIAWDEEAPTVVMLSELMFSCRLGWEEEDSNEEEQ